MDTIHHNDGEWIEPKPQSAPPSKGFQNITRGLPRGRKPFSQPKGNRNKLPSKRPFSASHSGPSLTEGPRVKQPKVAPKTGLQNVPRKRIFPIFTSNLGVVQLASICYDTIIGRDFRLAQVVSLLQLEYVLTIAFLNRIVQCAIQSGFNTKIPHASRLRQAARGIQLPDPLIKYIEALGVVELLNGTSIAPWVGSYSEMFPPNSSNMRDPLAILIEAGRDFNIIPDEWPIDSEWIDSWNQLTTRPSRVGMKFGTVNDNIEGRNELLCSYRLDTDYDLCEAFAPQILTEAENRLGACYSFRSTDTTTWVGNFKEILFPSHTAGSFDPHQYFTNICVSSFVARD